MMSCNSPKGDTKRTNAKNSNKKKEWKRADNEWDYAKSLENL